MQDEKLLDEIEERFKRHTNVLMEEMRSTVKTVAEQYSDLIKKLEKIGGDLDILKSEMQILSPAVRTHASQLKEIRSEWETVKLAIKDVDQRLAPVLADHEKRLKELETI